MIKKQTFLKEMLQTIQKEVLLLMTFRELVALQFNYKDFAFEENFEKFSSLVKKTPKNSIVVAPELCLSNFCYDDMSKAASFSKEVDSEIKKLSFDKTLSLTMIEKDEKDFVNRAKVYQNGKVVFQRDKYHLFKFGNEDKFFKPGKKEDIKVFEIDGIKYALIICFELRFVDIWKTIQGADVVLVPSLWGKLRKKHLEILGNALSLANQCFVVIANSANEDMAKSSLISTPFGKMYKDDRRALLKKKIDLKEIKKMRRYLDVGIKA
jgi:predicted amidohydrolase